MTGGIFIVDFEEPILEPGRYPGGGVVLRMSDTELTEDEVGRATGRRSGEYGGNGNLGIDDSDGEV